MSSDAVAGDPASLLEKPEYARIGFVVQAVETAYDALGASGIGALLTGPLSVSAPLMRNVASLLDGAIDALIVSLTASAEVVYGSLPQFLRTAVDQYFLAKQKFRQEFQSALKELNVPTAQTTAGGIVGSVAPQIEKIMTASRVAFSAVLDSSAEEAGGGERINIHGIWVLDTTRSEPWDALLEILGITHKKTVSSKDIKPSTQEFHHQGDMISHCIYSTSGKKKDSEPTMFVVGADPMEEKAAEGEAISTRYYYTDDGIVQEVRPRRSFWFQFRYSRGRPCAASITPSR